LVQIVEADVAVVHALDQMITDSARKPRPGFNLRHLLTEYKLSQLISQSLDLVRIVGRAEFFREFEERFLFLLARLDSLFDQFDEYAVVAQAASFRDAVDLPGYLGREGDAAANLLRCGHGTIVHQFGAMPCTAPSAAKAGVVCGPLIAALKALRHPNRVLSAVSGSLQSKGAKRGSLKMPVI
jgi:hypothetical protein